MWCKCNTYWLLVEKRGREHSAAFSMWYRYSTAYILLIEKRKGTFVSLQYVIQMQ